MWLISGTCLPHNTKRDGFTLLTAFDVRPTHERVWHNAFWNVDTKRRAVAQTRSAAPKMPWASSTFPLKNRAPQEGKRLGAALWGSRSKSVNSGLPRHPGQAASTEQTPPETKHTRPDPRRRACRSARVSGR